MAQSVLDAPHFHNEEAAYAYVEARLWPWGPECPHCGANDERIRRLEGKTTRIGLWKCYHCRKPFTVKVGTIFEDSHIPLRYWLQVIHLMCASKKAISTRQVQRMLQCSMKTAWHLTHRIREAMSKTYTRGTAPLGGQGAIVEADITYVGKKEGAKKKGGTGHVNPVLSLVERNGQVRSFHVANVTAETVGAVLEHHAAPESHLMTDEGGVFRGPGRDFASHHHVNHSRGEYVSRSNPLIHSNTVEGFFSVLKRGIYGTYQHVSEAHLQRYLDEFDFRYSHRQKLGFDDSARAEIALAGAKGKRLTYRTTRSGSPS